MRGSRDQGGGPKINVHTYTHAHTHGASFNCCDGPEGVPESSTSFRRGNWDREGGGPAQAHSAHAGWNPHRAPG